MFLFTIASALTNPLPGAVNLPGSTELTLPFPDGTAVLATCAYGPGCSGFHDGTNDPGSANDYYALDLVRNQAGNGDGEPVLAVAEGEVVYSDWASGGWASYGRIVLVEADFSDGNTYLILYAHLSSRSVSVGQWVSAKDEIGLMGGSSNGVDNWFGSHVHLAVYQNASFIGGPYGGSSVVPEPIDGYENINHGDSFTAGPGVLTNTTPSTTWTSPSSTTTTTVTGGTTSPTSTWTSSTTEPTEPSPTTQGATTTQAGGTEPSATSSTPDLAPPAAEPLDKGTGGCESSPSPRGLFAIMAALLAFRKRRF